MELFGKVRFLTVDINEQEKIASNFGIGCTPMFEALMMAERLAELMVPTVPAKETWSCCSVRFYNEDSLDISTWRPFARSIL